MVKKSEESPKTTKNGNKLFEGAKDGKPFKKGVKKTEAEKQAMRDGWTRKRVYEELFKKITTNLGIKLDEEEVATKDLIDALKVVSETLGDKINKQEITGSLTTSPTTFNILPVKSDSKK